MLIESLDNNKIKDVIKLKTKKYRDDSNLFIVETKHLVMEADKNNALLFAFKLPDCSLDIDILTYDVTAKVMNKLTDVNNCQVLGVCKDTFNNEIKGDRILLLDGVQDPGNVGTIIRSCLAFNIDTLILGEGTCDVFNQKVIRASEGAIFNVNIVRMSLDDAIKIIKERNIKVFGTDVSSGVCPSSINDKKFALIMGSEGSGMRNDLYNYVDSNVYINTNEKLESLNVAIATSIILYEFSKNF